MYICVVCLTIVILPLSKNTFAALIIIKITSLQVATMPTGSFLYSPITGLTDWKCNMQHTGIMNLIRHTKFQLTRKQCFGEWICFLLYVKGRRHLLC